MLLQTRAGLWCKRIAPSDQFSVRLFTDELSTSDLTGCADPSLPGERCIGQTTKHVSERTEKKLAANSSKGATRMKILLRCLQWVQQQPFKTRWESGRALPGLGASWTNRTGLRGTPSVFVSVCVCTAQCVIYCASAPAGPGIQWTVSEIASSHRWPAKPHAADLAFADPENNPENFICFINNRKISCAWGTCANVNSRNIIK